jgi:hypothetical protein
METNDISSPGMLKILKRIQALLDKTTERGCTEAEAAAAAAKAQEPLTEYNLDAAMVGQGAEQDTRREEQKIRGGFHEYERDLWGAVARLNFCLYWSGKVWVVRKARAEMARIERKDA